MNRFRGLISALLAVGVTFGLFLFMFKLISSGGNNNEELEAIAGIHFGPVEIPDEVMTKNRRIPKKPPPPKDPPPPPKMQVSRMDQTVQNMPVMDLPNLDIPMTAGEGVYIGNFATVDKTEEATSFRSLSSAPCTRVRPRWQARKAGLKLNSRLPRPER